MSADSGAEGRGENVFLASDTFCLKKKKKKTVLVMQWVKNPTATAWV